MTHHTPANADTEAWKCAGCGIHTPDLIKVCECATGCAYRRVSGQQTESVWLFQSKNHAEHPRLTPREADAAAALELIVKGRPGWRHAAEIALAALQPLQNAATPEVAAKPSPQSQN